MTEFVQTMQNWRRMCAEMKKLHPHNPCDGCGLEEYGCPIIRVDNNSVDFCDIEKLVSEWAIEHPEPVYPTWEMYLVDRMSADMRDGKTHNPQSVEEYMCTTRIPTDIADKLGIEPKEAEVWKW